MIARSVVLLVVWVLLQGELTVANLVGGLAVVAGLALLFPTGRRAAHRVDPVGAAVFVGTLLRDLVVSSWAVVVTVLRPTPDRIHTEVIPVQLSTRSPLVASIVANSISLTPGTLTVDVDLTADGHLLDVHVLGRVDRAEFTESILALERRVARAARFRAEAADDVRPDVPSEEGS